MLQAIRGTLTEDPDVLDIPGPDHVYHRGVILNLTYESGRTGVPNGACKLTAWDEQADALAYYEKGDEIEFIGRLNTNLNKDGATVGLSFTLVHLDEPTTVVSAMEQFFHDNYIPKERLTDRICRAEHQKESANNQQQEHLQM